MNRTVLGVGIRALCQDPLGTMPAALVLIADGSTRPQPWPESIERRTEPACHECDGGFDEFVIGHVRFEDT